MDRGVGLGEWRSWKAAAARGLRAAASRWIDGLIESPSSLLTQLDEKSQRARGNTFQHPTESAEKARKILCALGESP